MNSPEKQLKYSIRKVSVGAASVVIGALYLLMGAGIAHAEGVESARESERAANPTDPERSGNGEAGNKADLSNTDAAANTYNAPVAENPLVAPESTKPRTRSKRELPDEDASNPSSGATGTESEPTSGNEGGSDQADTDPALLDANRKGATVKDNQPGVHVPKDGEEGGDDKNANLTFDAPKENLTLEQLWDIVKNMPDDFQNNERSYLRNMNTLGDALNLEPGEIRELHDFGGWSAIDKEGNPGKFVIGRKNEQGYFTGWHWLDKEKGTKEQGGMLGGDALDNIYVHEQALDRRFRYMLMLVKGRTRANRDEKVSDNTDYDPKSQNERAGKNSTEYKNLPFLIRDKYNKYSPGVVGYNGIEKQFTAFSPAFGSRVRVEFVTGYISDINGSKGTYRVVIKTKNTAGQENTVYDQTIHRIAEIVQNEELYKKGLNVELAHKTVLKFFTDELNSRVNKIRNEKIKFTPLHRKSRRDYTKEDTKLYNQLEAEATEEAKKQGDIVLNVTEDFLNIEKSKERDSEWKKTFTNTSQSTTKLANELNNLLKEADKDTPNTPTWLNSSKDSQSKADDRAYRLLTTLIPGAKKIIYHVKDDQLEVETDKYTYTAARNGSKEAGIQGSNIEATESAETYSVDSRTFDRENTNTKANNLNNGWARSDSEEFKHFSHFVGVDKGIVRTKVLTDKELSDKIKDAVGPGDSNLGKGGYFSTGDVLLGKDVVSYTVQVFSENNERVGVNPQSHRVQYNLPILADFSVIQDTVEPSRNVVEKIIPKLNIPEEEKKKITEKIKEKKKTSELADLISGNVKVRYVDEQGRLLSLKNDTGIGEKESDGTYITNKKQLIGTSYDVTDKKLSSMTTTDGRYYTFEKEATDSASLTGNIVSEGRTVTLVYKESEAPAEVDATRTVKRTITYVKEDNVNGTIKRTVLEKQTKENTVTFTGKEVTDTEHNTVSYKDWTSTNSKFPKVDTPVLEGYIADIASVGEEEATAPTSTGEVTNLTKEVVYTKLGSWVPNLPKGVTPPEGTDMTPKPYPNNPTDPTKPGEPTDPTTPNVPVIPYVPGYTPNVGGTPLVPKNPTDLTEGYTPPTPTDPKTNIEINYTPDPQKAVVKVYTIRDGVKIELPNEKVSIDSGIPDAAIPSKKLDEKIKDLEKRGYIVDNKTPLKGETFDKVKDSETGDPSQVYELILRERTSVETETKSVTRTIKYYKIDETNGSKVEVDNGKLTNTKTAEFTREVTTNLATGLTTIGEWSDKQTLDEVKTPVLTGYIADKVKVPSSEVTADTESFEEEVVYKKIGSWVPKVPGVEKPTPIPYPNDPNDPTKPKYPDYPTTPGNPGETPNPQPDTPGGGTPEKPNPPPVIPYVPGYTPKIGETPLQPKVPNDPTQGYIPPAVPTEPGTNTDITYVADPQKAVVKVFNTTTGTEVEIPAEKVSIDNGTTDSAIPTDSVTAKIADLEKRGYVVENKDLLNNQKFDKEKDPTDGDPTQVFKLLVKERTVTVTEPKNPNDPVDPDKPEGPKWPATGLAKSDLEKEVTRTITYVKKETANGPEIADAKPTVTQTAHFKRSATYNAVTGTITYGNWESADKELAKVDTPELTGYVADKASVEKVETNADSTGLDQKVVYTKLGSWVLTPPTGVTPPEGTNFDPKPYPNNPTDPTRPGEPEYPQPGTPVEPNTPVIPYVPGYTPKIPTDPTQPVDPNTNPLVPLTPVDPNHPENGYKVPPVPTKPGEDTPITYEGNPQKALVKVVKVDGTTETPLPKDNVTINGKTGDQIPTESVTAKIAELEKRGYVIDNRDEVVNYINNKFDKDKDTEGQDPTQTVTLKVHEKVVPVTPPTDDKPLEPGKPIDPDTPVDPNNPNDPTIPRWTDELIKKLDVKKEVTRTINYVDEAGNKVSEPSTDKVTFTREAKINVVTGEITYGDWKAVGGDSTFDKVSSPVVKGYILKDPAQKEVAERKGITPTVANQTIEVVYKKLGSWVPKVPGVETPTPLPYPNNPTDPTKPGDPTDPTTPNVPVIPYVPGYTPKTPDGNPLVPVDPNHPENGYKVPPVPTEPGQDTPIEYVKVPNTPSPEEPVKPTPESNHITIWVDENGKPLKPEKPGTHEPGNIPGYRYITTVTKDGVTIHKFEKITPVDPNNPVPQKPTTPIPTPQDSTIPTPESQIPTPNTPEANTPTSETNRREELPNTGTEANASLASAGIMTLLAGLGLGFFKKKEEDESE